MIAMATFFLLKTNRIYFVAVPQYLVASRIINDHQRSTIL